MRRYSWLLVAALIVFSGFRIDFDIFRLYNGLPQMWSLLSRMANPQWDYAGQVMDTLVETLKMALAGALLGSMVGVILGILAARNVAPWGFACRVLRWFLAAIRTIPHVVWAALLVTIFSIGPGAGMIALCITSANIMAKLLSEYIENLDNRPLDALRGVGAGWFTLVVYGVLPRIGGQVWSLLFFCLEVNVRAAAVLGLVGAGGIGQLLWRNLAFLRYDRLATLILILFVTVALIDGASWLARKLQVVNVSGYQFRDYKMYRSWQWLKLGLGVTAVVFAVFWSIGLMELGWERFVLGLGQGRDMLIRMLNPDWTYTHRLRQGLSESLYITLFATGVGSLMAIPAAFLGATNLWGNKAWPWFNKLLVNFIRTFPAIILAVMFFRGVGPGPLAGALALTIYTTGVLGKLYTEIVESIDNRVLESVQATGATPIQVWVFGLLPRVLPNFVAASLYRMESNIRTATILGIIGAGGIGTWLEMNLSGRNWERVGLLLMGMIAMVMLVDAISGHLRRRLIN